MVWIGYSSPYSCSSPWLMISQGMVCLRLQWSANICMKCAEATQNYKVSGHNALKITCIFIILILRFATKYLFFGGNIEKYGCVLNFKYPIFSCNRNLWFKSVWCYMFNFKQAYSTEGMSESQLQFLQHLRELGLVFQRKVRF